MKNEAVAEGPFDRPRILFFLSRARLGGSQLSVLDLCGHLREIGIEPHVCTPGDGPLRKKFEDMGIPHLWLAERQLTRIGHLFTSMRSLSRVREYVRRCGIGAFCCSSLDGGVLFGLPLSRELCFVYHSRDLNGTPTPLFGNLRRMVLSKIVRRADVWICNSTYTRDILSPVVRRTGATVIHNGLDIGRFLGRAANRDVRPKDRRYQIGTVATLVPYKEPEMLLHAAGILLKMGIRVDLHFAGADPSPGQSYLRRLREIAARLGLQTATTWHGHVEDITTFYDQIDIAVLTCSREGFGRALVEAMAAGLPVVAPRSGGPLEIVTEGVDGRFFAPTDSSDLAHVIAELLNDEDQMRRMAKQARVTASERFCIDHTVRQFASTLVAAMNSRKSSRADSRAGAWPSHATRIQGAQIQ